MNRLTRKDEDGYYCGDMTNYEPYLEKLGQLEDIEEELGIDLITLFKALNNGIWVKNYIDNTIKFYKKVCYEDKAIYLDCDPNDNLKGLELNYVNSYDFGITWSTRKEGLLNE